MLHVATVFLGARRILSDDSAVSQAAAQSDRACMQFTFSKTNYRFLWVSQRQPEFRPYPLSHIALPYITLVLYIAPGQPELVLVGTPHFKIAKLHSKTIGTTKA